MYLEYSDEFDETVDNPEPPCDESDETVDNAEPPRRSARERRPPDFYGHQCNLSTTDEPKCAEDALREKK